MAAREINLLPKDKFETSTLGKLIRWVVSVGRWIVVFTEFIVICAFLSRFYFDTQLANLFDEIKQKKAMVNSASSFEESFRQIQERTKIVKNILASEKKPSGLLAEIANNLPLNVFLNEITIDEKNLSFSGYALSESGLNIFLKNLTRLPQLEQISLYNVSTPKESRIGVNFTVNAVIKKIK